MAVEYKPLESTTLNGLGIQTPTFDGNPSFYSAAVFIYTTLFIGIICVAFYELVLASWWRMQGSPDKIRMSDEAYKKVTLGLLGTFGMFLLLVTLNKDLLKGDIGLDYLRATASVGTVTTSGAGAQAGGSNATTQKTCSSVDDVKAKMVTQSGVCGGATCQALSGCNYQQYSQIIAQEASRAGIDTRLIIIMMCKESRADKNAQNPNPNGTYDCGLMQINQNTPCTQSSLDPATNISKGADLIKAKMGASGQVYQNIPAIAGVFASYNCCSNGTVPNSPSGDCTTASGFPFTLPKWACPINPGDGQFNMCTVKNYTCELTACLNDLSG